MLAIHRLHPAAYCCCILLWVHVVASHLLRLFRSVFVLTGKLAKVWSARLRDQCMAFHPVYIHSSWLKAGKNLFAGAMSDEYRYPQQVFVCRPGLHKVWVEVLHQVLWGWYDRAIASDLASKCSAFGQTSMSSNVIALPLSFFWKFFLFCLVCFAFRAVADKARPSRSEACFCGWTTLQCCTESTHGGRAICLPTTR
jgi:hypothetical protein